MKNKILLLAGLGAGYVLGTRAGRDKYDALVDQAQKLWGDPRVQDAVSTAKTSASDAAEKAQEQVKGAADTAKEKADEKGSSSNFGSTGSGTTTSGTTSGFEATTNTSSFGPGTDRI